MKMLVLTAVLCCFLSLWSATESTPTCKIKVPATMTEEQRIKSVDANNNEYLIYATPNHYVNLMYKGKRSSGVTLPSGKFCILNNDNPSVVFDDKTYLFLMMNTLEDPSCPSPFDLCDRMANLDGTTPVVISVKIIMKTTTYKDKQGQTQTINYHQVAPLYIDGQSPLYAATLSQVETWRTEEGFSDTKKFCS